MTKLEEMKDWRQRKLPCHYCGGTKRTQYKVDRGSTEIYVCKKCAVKVTLAVLCGDIKIHK